MPFNSEFLPTYSPQEFCRALKAVRERKGITLAEIAEATKVPASLFAGLERNDLRRWPKGLFRRSFFRDYVRMIGLPVAETCEEFVRLFPDPESAALAICATGPDEGNPFNVRLVLDAGWRGPRPAVLPRVLAALVDSGVVLVAAVFAWVAGMDLARTTAIVAVAYFSLGTVAFGESPAKWVISKRQSIIDKLAQERAAIASALGHSADAISGVLGSADGGTPEPVEEPHLQVRVKAS
jgi:hypothetical protein